MGATDLLVVKAIVHVVLSLAAYAHHSLSALHWVVSTERLLAKDYPVRPVQDQVGHVGGLCT
eukprot:scaffold663717_cov64-Prasinocladus_malaysianus.AAC.1